MLCFRDGDLPFLLEPLAAVGDALFLHIGIGPWRLAGAKARSTDCCISGVGSIASEECGRSCSVKGKRRMYIVWTAYTDISCSMILWLSKYTIPTRRWPAPTPGTAI